MATKALMRSGATPATHKHDHATFELMITKVMMEVEINKT